MADTPDLVAILNGILSASAVVKDRAILGFTYIRASERKALSDGFAALKSLAMTQPADKKWSVVPSPTGQLVSGYPSGTVPPPPGNPPVWAVIPSYLQKSASFSVDISTFLTGGYDTLSMAVVSGTLSGSGWAFTNPSLVYSGTGAGLLTVRFTATKNGLSSDSNVVTIESITLPSVDTIAPPTQTNLAVTLNGSNQPVVSFWPSADPAPAGQVWSGLKDYPIYRNASLLTRVSAAAGLQASLAPVVIGSPGGSSSFLGNTVTLTGVGGTSYTGTTDEGLGQGFSVTGNFTAIGRLASCTSTYAYAKAIIEFRPTMAVNGARVTAQHKPYAQGLGFTLQTRGAASAVVTDYPETANSTANLLLALVRTNQGAANETFTLYTKVVGGGLWATGPSAPITLAAQGTVWFGASANAVGQPAGITIDASWQDIVITQAAAISYTDTTATVGTTPSYTVSARDLALNESTVSTAVSIAIPSGSPATTFPLPAGAGVTNSAIFAGMPSVRAWSSLGGCRLGAQLCVIDVLDDTTRSVLTTNYKGTGVTVRLCSFRGFVQNTSGARIGMPIISGVCATSNEIDINDSQMSWFGATAPAPGFIFGVNMKPVFNGVDQTWQDVKFQSDNSTGGQNPDVVLDNRDGFGMWNNAAYVGIQRVSASGACDEMLDCSGANAGNNGVIDFIFFEPISKSGRGVTPGFEDKKYHGYIHIFKYDAHDFDLGRGITISANGRDPVLLGAIGFNCWDVYSYNNGPNPDGLDPFQGNAEIYANETGGNVTCNIEAVYHLAGPNTTHGSPWTIGGTASPWNSSRLSFNGVGGFDRVGGRYSGDQSVLANAMSLNGTPAGLISTTRQASFWPTGVIPIPVTISSVAGHVSKLNLIKRYCGFRPLERAVGRDGIVIDQPLNYIQNINSSNWGSIVNAPVSLLRPGDFPSTSVDLTAISDPIPLTTFFNSVVCADGVTRLQGLRWLHRMMKLVGAQDWGQ